jgi:hypothetical protein
MRVSSDFYIHKVADVLGGARDITFHAMGEKTIEPPDELTNVFGAPSESFLASGVLILRVTNPRLADTFRPGKMFHMVMEEWGEPQVAPV